MVKSFVRAPNMLNLNYDHTILLTSTEPNQTKPNIKRKLNRMLSRTYSHCQNIFVLVQRNSVEKNQIGFLSFIDFPFETMSHYAGRHFIRMTEPEILRP